MNKALLLAALLASSAALADDLPIPPRPPERVPAPEAAPVPDHDIGAVNARSTEGTSVQIKFYRSNPFDPASGYTPGSRFQTREDSKPIQTPGVGVTVPIE